MVYALQLLDEIAAKFYGVRQQNPLEGLFGEMFKVNTFFYGLHGGRYIELLPFKVCQISWVLL